MSVMLTDSQRAVVEDQGGSLLVSAAAGSGKTRVLVDRLFRRVLGEEQANMDDFLIITYTRAAAAELRERIAQELGRRMAEDPGDRHLQRQLLLVYQTDIKTIDSFCTALLRENVHLLDLGEQGGLTADFRVLDEGEAELLRQRVLPRVLESFYTGMTPGQTQLADCFGFGRDDRGLEELVLELHSKVQSHAYPHRWLEEQRQSWASLPEDGGETEFGRALLARLAGGRFSIERRMMLDVSVRREGHSVFTEQALNDAVVTKGAVARVLDLEVTGDRAVISSFAGDGLIVSTPTGSTAYSMAAGGPIVEPTAENIIITPICGHSLHAKPFVLGAGRAVGVRLAPGGKKTAYLSVDGGRAFRIQPGDWVECRRSRQVTRLVKLTGRSFYERINQKLGKA